MQDKLERRSFLLLLVIITVLFFWILKPFFGAVFWAIALTLIFYPLHRRLQLRHGDRPNTNALLTLLVCVLCAVVPIALVLTAAVSEGMQLYSNLESGSVDYNKYIDQAKGAFPQLNQWLERFNLDLEGIKRQLADAAVQGSRLVATRALSIGQNALQVTVSFALMLYLIFFFLRDGEQLVRHLIHALPLGDARERLLFAKFAEVTRATVKGNLVVAAVQGALGGFIFWALGINAAFLWGVVMAFVSLLPAVGAALIWAPVAIFFLATGEVVKGLILIAFGAGVIGLVDNVLRPILVGRDTKLPDWIVLLTTLGGISLFGLNGFVIGPLIAALFIAFWNIFARELNEQGA